MGVSFLTVPRPVSTAYPRTEKIRAETRRRNVGPGSTSRHHGKDRDRLAVVGFDEISWLRGNSPARRLLRAENAPLVLSFLDQVFVSS
jgi:hypothetical protein